MLINETKSCGTSISIVILQYYDEPYSQLTFNI